MSHQMPEELMTVDQYSDALNFLKTNHGGDSLIFAFDRSFSDLSQQVKQMGKEELGRDLSDEEVDKVIFSINPSPVHDAINQAIGNAFETFTKAKV